MPALSIRSLRKSFLVGATHSPHRIEALAGVDLNVDEGETLGIIGTKGAGKTTLLLCAAGLLRRDSGSLYWYGDRFAGGGCLPRLAYVPAIPTYYPFLTVRDVLDYYAAREDVPARRRCHLIQTTAASLSLTDQLSTPVSRLDIDTLKRVGIAQAFVEEPRAVLLDATLDGLSENTPQTHVLIRDAASRGVTIILASRDAGALAPLATRIVVMNAGRVTGSFFADQSEALPLHTNAVFPALPPQLLHIAERVH
jgi:ABC-2 type transport system ATP-binding protein